MDCSAAAFTCKTGKKSLLFASHVYNFLSQPFFLLLVGMPTTLGEGRLLNDSVTNGLASLFQAVIS